MNVRAAFVANAKSPKLVQPTYGPFDHPTQDAQSAAVLGIPARDERMHPAPFQSFSVGLGMVSAVRDHDIWAALGTPAFSFNRRNRVHQRNQLRHIVLIGSGDRTRQRNTLAIGEQVMFGPEFASIGGIRARFQPPKTARTLPLSTTARDQSSWSATWSR